MNINESIKDWIEFADTDGNFDDVTLTTMGGTIDMEPPLVAIYETSSNPYEQGDTTLYGVSTFEVEVELHTIPVDADNGGTADSQHKTWRRQLYDILGDRSGIDWITGKNYWRVFDIRMGSPITESEDGRQVSKWTLTVIACPLQP